MRQFVDNIFDPFVWGMVPFWFWGMIAFILGSMVGSLLNVCIHRMPRGESIVSPGSHCPTCNYQIPWFLNIPLVTWLFLRGRCANCRSSISPRYFLVELLTGMAFLCCWIAFGRIPSLTPLASATLALAHAVLLSGLIVATFIDFEHYIIPDEITFGGIAAGFVASGLAPTLHLVPKVSQALSRSALGIVVGGGLIYGILRLGKFLFGRQKVSLPEGTRVVFTENDLRLPDEAVPYDELFYRRSDYIQFQAARLELVDRCYRDVPVRLTAVDLRIGDEKLNPEDVPLMEAVTNRVVLPREAMGLGDVKFMAAIGAFLGPFAVVFSLMLSAIIGSIVGMTLIAMRKQEWSSRLPYGPYIALAAVIWIFHGPQIVLWWLGMS
jgi:leader peptidase (prepilin peptidase)/N-methyltransferase